MGGRRSMSSRRPNSNGRSASASTDVRMNAKILSYSRSRGSFAGLELKGVVIKPDTEDNSQVYGMTESGGPGTYLHPHQHVLDGPAEVVRRLGSAGQPMTGCDVRITT